MTYLEIPITRRQITSVLLKVRPGHQPTPAEIRAAIARTVGEDEWDAGPVDHGEAIPVTGEYAEEYHYYDLTAEPRKTPTMAARAAEIGISQLTLRKWRGSHGVDVFDDQAVKRHVAGQRSHNWKIATKFKASL